MATRRTKEEKLKSIADYETSGLSLSEWCATNGISKSTFAGWIRSTKDDVRTPKSKAKFVEVTLPTGLQEQPEPQARNTADITVEYKAFKITIPENIDVRTLENILKVVIQADV
jgi:transposase-like protein